MNAYRIAEERKRLGMNQSELAERVGVSQKSISKYELGTRNPSYEVLSKMAKLFDVSIDYLIGNSDNPHPEKHRGLFFFFFDEDLKDIFTARLNGSMEAAHIEREDILFGTEIEQEHLDKYLAGESEPSLEDLCTLSDLLGVTTDYLLGRVPEPTTKSQNMMRAFVNLDEDNQDIIIGETKKLLKEQRILEQPVAADGEIAPSEKSLA